MRRSFQENGTPQEVIDEINESLDRYEADLTKAIIDHSRAGSRPSRYGSVNPMSRKFKVVAHLPASIELTKRTSQNALKVDVNMSDSKEGTLVIARGSVEWWPDRNKVNAHRGNWEQFADLMEKGLPRKRSIRRRRKESPEEAEQRKANKIAAAKKAWVTIRKKKKKAANP